MFPHCAYAHDGKVVIKLAGELPVVTTAVHARELADELVEAAAHIEGSRGPMTGGQAVAAVTGGKPELEAALASADGSVGKRWYTSEALPPGVRSWRSARETRRIVFRQIAGVQNNCDSWEDESDPVTESEAQAPEWDGRGLCGLGDDAGDDAVPGAAPGGRR